MHLCVAFACSLIGCSVLGLLLLSAPVNHISHTLVAPLTLPVAQRNLTIANVTVIVKTMNRAACLVQLIRLLLSQHSSLTVMVADDGHQDTLSVLRQFSLDTQVLFYKMPLDSGLSRGRNLMVSQVTTPYVLLMDDDFELQSDTLRSFLEKGSQFRDADIIGGRAGLDFAGNFDVDTEREMLFLKPPHQGPECSRVEFVPNFFLVKQSFTK